MNDDFDREIREIFQIDHAFPTEFAPSEKARGKLGRFIDWFRRVLGFGSVPAQKDQGAQVGLEGGGVVPNRPARCTGHRQVDETTAKGSA